MHDLSNLSEHHASSTNQVSWREGAGKERGRYGREERGEAGHSCTYVVTGYFTQSHR